MISTHILKDGLNRTVEDILEFWHADDEAIVIIRNRPGVALIPFNELTIVPRAELLAGQVQVA